MLVSNYFKVLIPKTIGAALDYIFEKIQSVERTNGSDFSSSFGSELLEFSLIILAFALFMGVCMYMTRMTIIVVSRLIEYDLRKDLFEKYESMDLEFFKNNKTGDMMSRISEDVTKVRMYLGPAILYGLNTFALFFLVIFAMFDVNVTLSIYTLAPLPFLSISIYLVSSHINTRSEIIQRQLAKLNSVAQEVYSGIRVVKSYAKESQFVKLFTSQSEDFKEKSMSLAKVNAFFQPLMILLISLSTLLTIYIGGIMVSRNEISPGNIAEFLIYINYLTWPFTSIGWIASIVQEAAASQKRINEFMSVESSLTHSPKNDQKVKGKIEFKNVSFVYPETGILALDNVSFKIEAGHRLAVVGRTASGKSTIAELLLRMYDVTKGQILVDDTDIKDLDLDHLRKCIGYVPQDVFLFSDTIENNILFGSPDATAEEAKFYADKAAISKDIAAFEEGFQTFVGERGVTLSGGQKQRISIARAFVKKPDIVIMDDSLSAIDANTEHKILGYLNEALANKTSIIVTHRFFNLFRFDKIIVLQNGKIKESGTHESLMALKEHYFELFSQGSVEGVSS